MAGTEKKKLHLIQYRPAYAVQAYLQFGSVHFTVENSIYPFATSTGPLPQLRHNSNVSNKLRLVPSHNILSYLRENVVDLDNELTEFQRCTNRLIEVLVQEKLDVSLLYSRWMGWKGDWETSPTDFKQAFGEEMVQAYGFGNKYFPFNFLVRHAHSVLPAALSPVAFHSGQHAFSALSARGFCRLSKNEIAQSTENSYSILEALLGESSSPFFHNSLNPTTADAVVFGHVAEAMYEKVSSFSGLFRSKFPLLWKHFTNVQNIYFSQNGALPGHVEVNCANNFYLNGVRRKKQHQAIAAAKRDEAAKKKAAEAVKSGEGSASTAGEQPDKTPGPSSTERNSGLKGSFEQARFYEKTNADIPTPNASSDAGAAGPGNDNNRSPAEISRARYNFYFLSGVLAVMCLYGAHLSQNFLEELAEED